eukprot:50483_1
MSHLVSVSAVAVNVKITYKYKTKRRNDVKSLKELNQVIKELFKELHQIPYELSYTDNEHDRIIIDTEKCFEAAMYSVYNNIYYQHDQIKKDCDINDIRRKLIVLKIKINKISDEKHDDEPERKYESFRFNWCSKMKGANIGLSQNNMKSQLSSGSFHAVRGSIPIPKGSISEWKMIVFIDRSTSGNFYGVMSSEVTEKTLVALWYNYNQTERVYGVDDNPTCVYQGGARIAPKWKTKAIPFKTETELKFIADYTKNCCVLTIEMNGEWLYQFLLSPNKEWYPAVQFEEPGSWAKIIN